MTDEATRVVSDTEETKRCTGCREVKPRSAFSKDRTRLDGLQARCKSCARVYKEANREQIAARKRAWREANREQVAAHKRAWSEANPDKVRARNARRRARKTAAPSEWIGIDAMRTRDGDACTLCLQTINFDLKHPDPGSPSREHLLPLSEGGHDTPDNLAISHLRCNLRRGAKDLAEFRAFLAAELKEQK